MSELREKIGEVVNDIADEYYLLNHTRDEITDRILSRTAEEVEKMKLEPPEHLGSTAEAIIAVKIESRNKTIDDVLALLKGGGKV
jgi:hypothetical protein